MKKSQLRNLAAQYADGLLSEEEYRQRRRRLIDAVVEGREPPEEQADELSSGWDVPAPILPVEPATRGAPRRGLLGLVAIACVAVLAFVLWPAGEPPPSAPPAPSPRPAQEIPRARTLVESFLALRDFSPEAINKFREQWSELSEMERQEARSTVWFTSLVRALGDEMRAQRALAELDTGDAALERARHALALGEELGVADQLPELEGAAPVAAAPAEPQDAQPGPRSQLPPGQPPASEPVTRSPAPAVPSNPPGETGEALTGRQWLGARSDDELTLQLFAVNGLSAVEKLMAAHPELSVHVLETSGAAPRYRVFHGVFADAAAARQAYDALPGSVTAASGGAIVKSFAAVREDLYGASPALRPGAPQPPGVPQAETMTSRAGAAPGAGNGGAYTLQLFASGNRANAEALMKAYPALSLQLRESHDRRTLYRVIYGNFESAEAARAASGALPPALVSRIGTPVPKRIADIGAPASP